MPDAMQGKRAPAATAPRLPAPGVTGPGRARASGRSPAAKVYGSGPGRGGRWPSGAPRAARSSRRREKLRALRPPSAGCGLTAAAGGKEGPIGSRAGSQSPGRWGGTRALRWRTLCAGQAPRKEQGDPARLVLGVGMQMGAPRPRCAPRELGTWRRAGRAAGATAAAAPCSARVLPRGGGGGWGSGRGEGDRIASALAAARSGARGVLRGLPGANRNSTSRGPGLRRDPQVPRPPRPRRAGEKLPRPRARREQCEEEPRRPSIPGPSRARMCGPATQRASCRRG